jgi:hypothetical protein
MRLQPLPGRHPCVPRIDVLPSGRSDRRIPVGRTPRARQMASALPAGWHECCGRQKCVGQIQRPTRTRKVDKSRRRRRGSEPRGMLMVSNRVDGAEDRNACQGEAIGVFRQLSGPVPTSAVWAACRGFGGLLDSGPRQVCSDQLRRVDRGASHTPRPVRIRSGRPAPRFEVTTRVDKREEQ